MTDDEKKEAAQRLEERYSEEYGKNVTVDPPYPGGSTLVGFDGTGMVMRFNFKCTSQPIPYVYQSRILITRSHEQVLSFTG